MVPKGGLSQVPGEGVEKSHQARARSRSPPTLSLLITVFMPGFCPCPVLVFNSIYSVPGSVSQLLLACKSPDHLACPRCKVTREQTAVPQSWFVFLWTFKVYPVSFDVKTTPARDEASKVKVSRSVLITPDFCWLTTWVALLNWNTRGTFLMSLCCLSPGRQCITVMKNLENTETEYTENTRINNS